MSRVVVIVLLGLLTGSLSFSQTYQLRGDVIDEGGTKISSSSYILRGSFGQPTTGKLTSANYVAYIGFWHPYPVGPGIEEDLHFGRSIPIVFSLSQNYPNPFGELTIINYQLPEPIHTTLRIYDLSGRVVRTLVSENQEPGYYEVKWNLRGVSGDRLPSGVYFYRIRACPEPGRGAGSFIRTRKMVILR